MKRSNYLFFYFLTLFLQLKIANDDEYIYHLLEFMRPGPKTKKSVDFVLSHWISYVLELEYANRTYTQSYPGKHLPKTRTEGVLYLEVYDTPAGYGLPPTQQSDYHHGNTQSDE